MRSLILLLMLAAAHIAQADDWRFSLPSQEYHYGSHIMRGNAAYSEIPFDKSYGELTREQQLMVRAEYESMGADDEPPFPLRGLKKLFHRAEEAAGIWSSAGEMDIRVLVGADGKALSARIYSTPDMDMARALAGLMLGEAYKPALCAGTPCAQEFRWRMKFEYE